MLKKVLDYSVLNQKVIAHNIANVETPGYTAKKVEFSESLADAVKSGDMERLKSLVPQVTPDRSTPYRMDMNNVDLEKEVARMAENRIQHDMVAAMLKKQLNKWTEILDKVQ